MLRAGRLEPGGVSTGEQVGGAVDVNLAAPAPSRQRDQRARRPAIGVKNGHAAGPEDAGHFAEERPALGEVEDDPQGYENIEGAVLEGKGKAVALDGAGGVSGAGQAQHLGGRVEAEGLVAG